VRLAERGAAGTIAGATGTVTPGAEAAASPAAGGGGDLAARAQEHYERAIRASATGNWAL